MFWILLVFVGAEARGGRPGLRVAQGITVPDNEYPYIVAIVEKANEYLIKVYEAPSIYQSCTGTLVASAWILTAAHCGDGEMIRYGDMSVAGDDPAATYSDIKEWFPFNTDWIYSGEIALARVDEVPIQEFGVVSGTDYLTLLGYPVSYFGFGFPGLIIHLTKKQLKLELKKKLRKQMGEAVVVKCPAEKDLMRFGPYICLATKCKHKRQNAVSGDSGGPLIHAGKIVGVCSVGDNRKLYATSLYTPVSPYLDWIKTMVTPESKNCLRQNTPLDVLIESTTTTSTASYLTPRSSTTTHSAFLNVQPDNSFLRQRLLQSGAVVKNANTNREQYSPKKIIIESTTMNSAAYLHVRQRLLQSGALIQNANFNREANSHETDIISESARTFSAASRVQPSKSRLRLSQSSKNIVKFTLMTNFL